MFFKKNKPLKDIFIDQFGNKFYANTLKELKEQLPGRVSKMYLDHEGAALHVGYIIGNHWLNRYAAVAK